MSLAAVVAESAARRPDHPAIVFAGRSLTYRQLWTDVCRYAAVLRARGVGEGDKVAVLLPNVPEFAMAYYGVLTAGAVAVPVNALLRREEIAYVLRDAGARVLICHSSLLREGGAAAKAAGVPVLTVADLDTGQVAPVDGYVPRAPDDIAVVLYTSGTTGQPKGAMLTHLSLLQNVQVTMLSPFDFRAGDVLLGCLPLFHTFGQICGMTTCFLAGATMVLMPRFDAASALRLIRAHGCTVFMGVPTMFITLLESVAGQDPPRLDRAYSGGAALPVAVLEEFERVFGCPIYEGYGLTETSPVVAYNQRAWPRRPGTVGRPIWGVEVAIARADREDAIELLPTGEVGEIVIRGHNVMAGYLNRPEATEESIVDGWFRSGDLGTRDADGYLSVVDRKKDMVVRGGFNVYPREIEGLLMRHPSVALVAVIGVPHELHGEEVCAVVVARSGVDRDADEIVTWCRRRLAAYKYPRIVEFVDELPLGPSGKVLKRELVAVFRESGVKA